MKEIFAHPKQCRRLRPKPKSVSVTREALWAAWVESRRRGTEPLLVEPFNILCGALGLDESEGK
jgi:hypothetical protein